MKCLYVIVCVVILFSTAGCRDSENDRFDIVLEGPWILYVDNTLAPWPVLIAIAPNTHSAKNWQHEPTVVSSGEAYLLGDFNNNLMEGQAYCLTLDSVCGSRGESELRSGNYPTVETLHMKMNDGHDGWVRAVKEQSATAIVLPVPDFYSSDGTWAMRFAPYFDGTEKPYTGSERHSIGVQLHYKKGPREFGLDRCENFVLGNCQVQNANSGSTTLPNTGTLRIVMKAPATNWGCDPHVRRIYPMMMKIVGPGGNKKNMVIDPAHALAPDGITGLFDNTLPADEKCLPHDAQSGQCDKQTPVCDAQQGSSSEQWFDDVLALREKINAADPATLAADPYLAQISSATKNLAYPRISQLDYIQFLVGKSQALLDEKEKAKTTNRRNIRTEGETRTNDLTPVTTQLVELQQKLLITSVPGKTGSDCKAGVMEAQ
jgi:hypothetical protein